MKHTRMFSKISVIGLGYIGLPTATMFASCGIEVVGVDVSESVVETVNMGNTHIVEPELSDAVSTAVKNHALRATTKAEPAEAFLIAVPTPLNHADKTADLSHVKLAAEKIASVLRPGNLVVLESTCPVGTTEKLSKWLECARPDLTFPRTAGEKSDIRIAYCPERVLPGQIMRELRTNDRLIGGITQRCAHRAADLYRNFVTGECVIASSSRVAEMGKLTENSFRDVNIAFANELSMICDQMDIDVWELITLANRHPRVNILSPGPGVGGHCIAVDPWFIVSTSPELTRVISTARQVNDAKPDWVLNKVHSAISKIAAQSHGKNHGEISICIYGLTFKPDIDDLRESPALSITRKLAQTHPGPIYAIDPYVSTIPRALKGTSVRLKSGATDADIHLFLVNHKIFKTMRKPDGTIVDATGIWKLNNSIDCCLHLQSETLI